MEENRFEYVYVEEDGTVRELDKEEIEYINTEFEPTDGARPYIKNSYEKLTPDNKIWGFLLREKVPRNIPIKDSNEKYLLTRDPISIYDSGKTIRLQVGVYKVKVLGGWGVTLGEFIFSLKNQADFTLVHPKIANFRFQSYELGRRAKKIMVLDIQKPGKYTIEFKNQQSLMVRRSNLVLMRLFEKEVPNKDLKIWIG